MPSNYQAITKHNEEQLGRDTASRKTQISMYSDSTHFVYEILQNADDYEAKEVFFKLSETELWIEHDGKPFTEENVKAITYFGQSTSREDLVKTGRFGIGFKSVFAFTATPIIISDCEHFKIYGLYRVKEYPYPDDLPRSRTRIILPFNHESENPDYVENLISREDAYSKIEERLTSLNKNTLLFTQNIREIRWETNDGSGYYSREDDKNNNARMTTITDGEHVKKYLVFSRGPRWKDEVHKTVDVAFGIDEKGAIVPVPAEEDFLYVLFATKEETHLRFILNGPYRTTPARENISEDDSFNRHLMKETCDLVEDMLPQIQKEGLLTTKFLAVLPNEDDEKLRDFYKPIMERLVELFNNEKLTPMKHGGHAAAKGAFRVKESVKLSDLIDDKDLARILGDGHSSPLWIKNPQSGSQEYRFLDMLEIKEWRTQDLIDKLSEESETIMKWLKDKSDKWHQRFYALLGDFCACPRYASEYSKPRYRDRKERLANLPIVRLSDGATYKKGKDCKFPSDDVEPDKNFSYVAKGVYSSGKNKDQQEEARKFLEEIGVSEVGEKERIDLLLETFYQNSKSTEITNEQHLNHITDFIKWWEKGNDMNKFKHHTIFRVEGKDVFHNPIKCFLDRPFEDTGLEALFGCSEIPLKSQKYLVSKKYTKVNGFIDFAKSLGVMSALEIRKHKATKMQEDVFKKMGRETCTTIDRDYFLNALIGQGTYWHNKGSSYYIGELDLKIHKIELSLAVWKTLCRVEEEKLSAFYLPNDANRDKQKREPSFLVNQLKSCRWVPDKDGFFRFPSDVTKESLHADFPYNNRNGWLDAIGFGENAKKQSEEYKKREKLLSSLPIEKEMLNFSPEEQKEMMEDYKRKMAHKHNQSAQQESVLFHEALPKSFIEPGKIATEDGIGYGGSVQNPSRRRDRTSESIAADIENEGKQGARLYFATVKKWKGKNDQVRVNLTEWYGGQCQICDKTFTQSNGEPYFEGLYLVSYTNAEWIDRVGNVLCLCPWHSAMFQFGPKEIDEDIIQQILRLQVQAEGGGGQLAIRLRLCGEDVEIKFEERHLIDLQEMIKKSQELERPSAD